MSAATRAVLADIAGHLDWPVDQSRLTIDPSPVAIAGALPISDVAAGAYGALALAAAELSDARGGGRPAPSVDRGRAGAAMTGAEFLTIDGAAPELWDPLTGHYACADGRHLYLHANFPHLRDGLLDLFGAAPERAALAAALADLDAFAAEEAAQARGLCAIVTRQRAEWEAHPQRAALAARPLAALTRLGGAPAPRPARRALAAGEAPLAGLRVLDLSRVIAGPMAGRALAELGADVLRVGAPHLPVMSLLSIDTGHGKRATDIDLREAARRETLWRLIETADVLIDGFRPGALAAKGFSASAIAARNPAIAIVALSAFDDIGPWAGRRGFDTYVQAGAGFCWPHAAGEAPRRLPVQPLDFLTGCLGAIGAIRALQLGEARPGAHLIELSLARTAIWLWEMADRLPAEPAPCASNISIEDAKTRGWLREVESAFGRVGGLAPPYALDGVAAPWRSPPTPLGSAAPAWLSD